MTKARIIRAVSGVLLIAQCVALIALFGLLPLLRWQACPVLKEKSDSVYRKGSLAFVREVKPESLKAGDIAVYYRGDTPVGAAVESNNKANSSVLVKTESGTQSVAYRKLTGKGSFSVPLLGGYANWLVHGKGVPVTVIGMGVLMLLFAVSAFLVRDPER